MQNYSTGLVGAVTVFLRDYDPSGPSHVEITNGTVFARDWQEGSGDFVERMALVLGTNYTLLVGHELEAWVVVDNESGPHTTRTTARLLSISRTFPPRPVACCTFTISPPLRRAIPTLRRRFQ